MDLGAYANIPTLDSYVTKHYGEVPRLRGIRLMKLEKPTGEPDYQMQIFDGYCGQDVIYIHTRCGSAWFGDDDPDANYIACGGKKWEEANSETFIESMNDESDGTYRDHYFRAVIDDEYRQLLDKEKRRCRMTKPDYPTVTATVIDEDTIRYGGSAFKRERTCHIKYPHDARMCSECDYYVNRNSLFCSHCGARVERDV